MRVIKEFQSKKNKVYLVEYPVYDIAVKKVHTNIDCFNNEVKILATLSAVRAPKVYSYDFPNIYMEYIEGDLLLDEIMSASTEEQDIIGKKVINFLNWFLDKTKGLIQTDYNFRNFIIKNDCCYGIDFENTQEGDINTCVAKMIAFCYLYDFEKSKKKAFCQSLLKYSAVNIKDIFDLISHEINFLKSRRCIQKSSN
ncbi:MAG: hypothetical protein ACOCWI_04060, partial [Bacillota bacterium]